MEKKIGLAVVLHCTALREIDFCLLISVNFAYTNADYFIIIIMSLSWMNLILNKVDRRWCKV